MTKDTMIAAAKSSRHIFNRTITIRELLFLSAAAICLSPLVSPPMALLTGLVFAQFIGHPYMHLNHKATHILLQVSIVGLGFGINISSALKAGKEGIQFTVVSIVMTLLVGWMLGRLLKMEKKTAFLIASGTAICGGSAIAALAPVIKAHEKQISVALGVVFILNSVALLIFPFIGHFMHLSQTQFGLWCAIAIHDTSSVVGAAAKFGDHALEVATTVKLARALWIIPLSLLAAVVYKNKSGKIKVPYFIFLFILAIVLNSYLSPLKVISPYVVEVSRAGLTLTLFLIGCGLSRKVLKTVGFTPFFQGVVLWILIAVSALFAVVSLA